LPTRPANQQRGLTTISPGKTPGSAIPGRPGTGKTALIARKKLPTSPQFLLNGDVSNSRIAMAVAI